MSLFSTASGDASVFESTDCSSVEPGSDFAVRVAVVSFKNRTGACGVSLVALFAVYCFRLAESNDCRLGRWSSVQEGEAGSLVAAVSNSVFCCSRFVSFRSYLLLDSIYKLERDAKFA